MKVTVHVPIYAMSRGTLIALAADEITMGSFSELGPIDPEIAGLLATSIVQVKAQKPIAEISDLTHIFASMDEKALKQVKSGALELVVDKIPEEWAKALVDKLASGQSTHDYALTAKDAQELGLNLKTDIPSSVLDLMRLYPQLSGG